jgi:hypothetical protein
MMDSKGRVWLTSKIRQAAPAWCSDVQTNKFADFEPGNGTRQASFYDPKTQKFQLIETCYATHHVQIDNDANETVYFNELSGPVFGWVDSKVYDQTLAATKDEIKAEQAAVGWCGQFIDTNGDGKITKPFQEGPRQGFTNLCMQPTRWLAPTPRRSTCGRSGSPPGSRSRRTRSWRTSRRCTWWWWTWWWTRWWGPPAFNPALIRRL